MHNNLSSSDNSKVGGRPSKGEQIQMQKVLRKYFERGISATSVSSETGYNIKTVCKYFDEWAEQIMDLDRKDFFEQQKLDRVQIISSFDKQIIDAYKFLDEISEQISYSKKKDNTIPKYLLTSHLEVMRYISSITEKRGAFLMSPVIDRVLKDKILEMMKNGQN
ncbi:MAG: hypothetical protein KGI28_08450 [Thaumarchaeota archaeon]|nr:hypothetical protein [Nitrososphaerota archaeon]